jgi:NAD(P)H-dependent FMN reductase
VSPDAGWSEPFRVLCLSGSLRQRSANSALLKAAAQLSPPALQLYLYEGLPALPPFNPDIEVTVLPESAAALRQAVGQADALLIACPEYAHGVPGSFKNLLDWLVGSLEFPDKPVALWNASARESHHAQDALREILVTMSASLVGAASVTIPLPGAGCDVSEILNDPARRGRIHAALASLVGELAGTTGG